MLKLLVPFGVVMTLAACQSTPQASKNIENTPNVGMANPASVYCVEEAGGQSKLVTDADGNQRGICHLSDGTTVDEWELFRKNRVK
ncbi:putative hemolysin [Psychrobacter sp.]|uniref:putative hemolysin n=1 Tax=Psychrobacter sp. TaxID=56811 RepID=UPI0026479CA9|nr:DUF333 domain-containing protein [Psychrobacter sp.]MDN6276604.1 DUF333 domain-containing protein [Psychrobacter sp.]MDN6308269.1 DUF333 domain-containing protein [Psychrobacter sp.]